VSHGPMPFRDIRIENRDDTFQPSDLKEFRRW
jgi:hypothetical protein